jgi:hypothetical protein
MAHLVPLEEHVEGPLEREPDEVALIRRQVVDAHGGCADHLLQPLLDFLPPDVDQALQLLTNLEVSQTSQMVNQQAHQQQHAVCSVKSAVLAAATPATHAAGPVLAATKEMNIGSWCE